ncbi:MAG: hypothetical protein WAM07_04385, partial [Halobacillus sp.]
KYEQETESLQSKIEEYKDKNRRHQAEMKNTINEKKQLAEEFGNQKSSWSKQKEEHKAKVEQLYAEIERLQNANTNIQEQYEDQKAALEKEKEEEAVLLTDMEKQMNFLLGGTMREDNPFNGKVAFIKALERKLEELTNDIHELEESIDGID